ncbi:sirohydrochlorin cobaltochelatase [Streptococcus merionis]|uniref:CbiK protein n=1 Tax=Streptococcus merionis TaxID=400065 RepID=A0A239SPU7_9STRE|nr:sirohydrochlorin cobaltochelatase [Streptococcus merionis]SNU86754.1 CbiK protein [Streptococcus merionis]
MTKAILVVSFGTTYPETRKKTIEACELAIQRRFTGYQVYRAFTSTIVMRRIKENENLIVPTVKEALEQMSARGIREVYIQPLHIILGAEYEKIVTQAKEFTAAFDVLKIGKPLLNSQEDYEKVRAVLLEKYGQFGEKSATVLMGHGSQHYAFTAYAAMDHMLAGSPVRLGCVESYPPIDMIEAQLQKDAITDVHLAPFMLVAGDHATNDLVSEADDSWYTYFASRGYQVSSHLIGLGEYAEIQELYIEHLEEIIQ